MPPRMVQRLTKFGKNKLPYNIHDKLYKNRMVKNVKIKRINFHNFKIPL